MMIIYTRKAIERMRARLNVAAAKIGRREQERERERGSVYYEELHYAPVYARKYEVDRATVHFEG